MKKLVLKLDLHDGEKAKKKAMAIVSGIEGVVSLSIDMKDRKMTVVGEVDAVEVTRKLKKLCHAQILTLGENKDEKRKEGDNKKEVNLSELEMLCRYYYLRVQYPPMVCVEENPNSCVIC